MPGDFSRKVARAAAVGGGRSYRSQTPRGWYALLLAICLVGITLVAYSRYERTQAPPVAAAKPKVPPTANSEWEVGVAVDVCHTVVDNALTETTAGFGTAYDSLGHGLVNIAPSRATVPADFEGNKANVASYLAVVDVGLSSKKLQLAGVPKTTKKSSSSTKTSSSTTTTSSTTTSTTTAASSTSSTSSSTTTTTTAPPPPPRVYTAGVTRCSGTPGVVKVETWSSPSAAHGVFVSPDKVTASKWHNGELITIAFVPSSTTSLPKPPVANKVAQFLASNPLGTLNTPTSSVPTSSVPTSSQPAGSTTSSTTPTSSSTTTTTAKSKKSKKS